MLYAMRPLCLFVLLFVVGFDRAFLLIADMVVETSPWDAKNTADSDDDQ